jgi:hypothetical protein
VPGNLHARLRQHSTSQPTDNVLQPRALRPFATGELRLLLLENISKEAVRAFQQRGFQVDHHTKAWSEEELLQNIGQYHAIGIRSKTRITQKVLKAATKVRLVFSNFLARSIPAGITAAMTVFSSTARLHDLVIHTCIQEPASRSSTALATRCDDEHTQQKRGAKGRKPSSSPSRRFQPTNATSI